MWKMDVENGSGHGKKGGVWKIVAGAGGGVLLLVLLYVAASCGGFLKSSQQNVTGDEPAGGEPLPTGGGPAGGGGSDAPAPLPTSTVVDPAEHDAKDEKEGRKVLRTMEDLEGLRALFDVKVFQPRGCYFFVH